jgi:hypothetical protein
MPHAGDRFGEVAPVDLHADEIDAEIRGGDRGAAEAQEQVHQHARALSPPP